jgi:hypothetical protein
MTPAAVAAPYASEIVSTFDIDKPERLNTLFRRRGEQGLGFFRIIESMGFKLPAAQDLYEHDEEDWIHETFHSLNPVGAPGPGNNALITLDPGDLDVNNNFYPRLWDQVLFPQSEVTGAIIDIDVNVPSAPVITVRPSDITDDIGAIGAGQELVIFSGGFSEGSGQPKGAVSGTFHYENELQIIKETLVATGTEMTNQKWFDKLSQPGGQSIPAYYMKGQLDTDYRMNLKIDGALLFGKRTTNPTIDPATGRPIKTTEGLVPYIRRVGNTRNYTSGAFSVQKFNEAVKILDKEFAADYVCSLNGINLAIEIEDTLVDYFKDTNINYVTDRMSADMFGGNKALAASVAFKMFTKGERTFALKRMPIFSHAKLYGASGYNHAGQGILIPMGKKKDKLTNMDLPTFGCRYKKLGPYSRMMEVWNVSGAGPNTKVIAEDLHNYYMRCHVGFHGMAGNQMILWDPA